jgi:type I restriction enzyme R subunit
MPSPEEVARQNIDMLLNACGWIIQKRSEINLSAGRGIAADKLQLLRQECDQLTAIFVTILKRAKE